MKEGISRLGKHRTGDLPVCLRGVYKEGFHLLLSLSSLSLFHISTLPLLQDTISSEVPDIGVNTSQPAQSMNTVSEESGVAQVTATRAAKKKIAKKDVNAALQAGENGETTDYSLMVRMVDPADGKPEGKYMGRQEQKLPPRLKNLSRQERASLQLTRTDQLLLIPFAKTIRLQFAHSFTNEGFLRSAYKDLLEEKDIYIYPLFIASHLQLFFILSLLPSMLFAFF